MKFEKLINFRRKKGLTRKQMYEKLYLSKSYYEKVEYGLIEAGKGFIKQIVKAFPEDKEEILKIFF